MQDGCRNVDVVQLADPGRVEAGAVCIDLGDLFAADEADRVEVVNVEIAEDAAGRGDVLRGGRNGIVRRGTHDQDLSDAARRNGVARRSVARVEAPLETHLDDDAGAVDRFTDTIEGREVERDRLLAERCRR